MPTDVRIRSIQIRKVGEDGSGRLVTYSVSPLATPTERQTVAMEPLETQLVGPEIEDDATANEWTLV